MTSKHTTGDMKKITCGYCKGTGFREKTLSGKTKWCYSCNEVKDLVFFSKNKSRADGFAHACMSCIDKLRRARYKKKSIWIRRDNV